MRSFLRPTGDGGYFVDQGLRAELMGRAVGVTDALFGGGNGAESKIINFLVAGGIKFADSGRNLRCIRVAHKAIGINDDRGRIISADLFDKCLTTRLEC